MQTVDTITRLLFSLGLNGDAAVSFRNRLVNGSLAINQRAAPVSPTVYEPGAFIRDRWRAGSGGCTAACAIAPNGDPTLHIGAGSVLQSVEGRHYLQEGGNFCLSWKGTAIGRLVVPGETATLTAGPVVVPRLKPGSDALVEFGISHGAEPVSLQFVQLEPGSTPSVFERRDDELRRCQRYFIRLTDPPLRGVVCGSVAGRCGMPLPVQMRTTPTVILSGALQIFDGVDIAAASSIIADYSTADSLEMDLQLDASLAIGRPAIIFAAERSGVLDVSAELELFTR
ncbi:hypothetical protein [Methylobacterium sp. CM6246]